MRHATAIACLALTCLAVLGCEARPSGPPANYETPAPNSATKRVCDAVVKAYFADRLLTVEAKKELRDAANSQGVDGRVRSSIVDGLYAQDQLPQSPESMENRYRLVVSACRRTGWN